MKLSLSLFFILFFTAFNLGAEVALDEYDVVAYFSNQLKQGSDKYSHEHNGKTYYFTSKEHLDRFSKKPEAYLPQYDGFCAYGMASGSEVPSDPTAYSVVGGKLYLNYSKSIRERWEGQKANYIRQADQQWSNR